MKAFACSQHTASLIEELIDVLLRQHQFGGAGSGCRRATDRDPHYIHLDFGTLKDMGTPVLFLRRVAFPQRAEFARQLLTHALVRFLVDSFVDEQPGEPQCPLHIAHLRGAVDAVGRQIGQMIENRREGRIP